jgi:hypothetical protein
MTTNIEYVFDRKKRNSLKWHALLYRDNLSKFKRKETFVSVCCQLFCLLSLIPPILIITSEILVDNSITNFENSRP